VILLDIFTHCNLLIKSFFKEENGIMFFRYTQPSFINMCTLISLSSLNPLYSIRLCNEIIEDNINNFIKEILEQQITNINEKILTNNFF